MSFKIIDVNEEFINEMNYYREAEGETLFEACRENPVVFVQKMLGARPYAWQVYTMIRIAAAIRKRNNDSTIMIKSHKKNLTFEIDGQEFVIITSRQIGKSTMLAFLSLWCTVFNHLPATAGNNTSFGIVSATDQQAKKLLLEIKKWMRMGDAFMKKEYDITDFFSELLDDKGQNNASVITFKAHEETHGEFLLKDSDVGSVIKSYPPTSVVLGETFSAVVIDEAGHSEKINDEFFYDYMYPTGNSTDAIRLYTSTPWGASGFFYRMVNPDGMYEESPAFIVAFTIEAIKLENPKYYEYVLKLVTQMNADGKIDEVQRAYYCRFVKGESSYFNPDKVIPVFQEYEMYESFKGECDLGVDFGGQVKSRTVLTISTLTDEGEIRRLYHKAYPVGKDNTIIQDIEELMTKFNIQRVIPDDCLVAGTEVLMSDRTRKPIEDIKPGEYVLSYNFDTEEYEDKQVIGNKVTEPLETYEVKFRNGSSVETSPHHKWFVKDRRTGRLDVKYTAELNPKTDYIPAAINIPDVGEFPVTKEEAYLLGMYIAEGHKRPTKKAFFISQLKGDIRDKIKSKLLETNFVWQENKKGFYLSDVFELKELFDKVGKGSYNKRIPSECFQWSHVLLESLYEGLIDGDGCIQKEHKDSRGYKVSRTESYYTSSSELNNDVRLLMLMLNKPTHNRFRVHSGFGSDKVQYEPVWSEGSYMNEGKLFIASVKKTGLVEKTYCIEVEDNKSFILPHTGAITHNCPQGDYLIRQMNEKGWDVHPMNFRRDKVKKYGAFRSQLNKEHIISYTDVDLQTEMLAMEFSNGSRQSIIQHAPGYSDDLIDSFVMSTYFFIEEGDLIEFFDYGDLEESNKPKSVKARKEKEEDKLFKEMLQRMNMTEDEYWRNESGFY